MIVIGIDPGLTGGISGIDTETNTLWAVPMPVIVTKPEKPKTSRGKIKKIKTEYDIAAIARLLEAISPDRVCMEAVHSMPNQGVSSVFRFGTGYGILLGVIGTLGYPLRLVTPRVWKSKYSLSSDKETSRLRATEFFPDCAKLWRLKKHDGIAESALLAHYGLLDTTIDLLQPRDISPLYQIEVSFNGISADPGRHHNHSQGTKSRRTRDSTSKCGDQCPS